MRKKLASLLLAMVLVIALLPTAALAEGNTGLWVNGVDIVTAQDNTVSCGEGTATYDAEANILTLDNATITATHMGSGIMAGSYFDDQELTVALVGESKITPAPGGSIAQGIYTDGKLLITGSGSLCITTCTLSENESTFGISAFSGCHIDSTSVTLTDTTAPALRKTVQGIDSNASQDGYFTCDGATLRIDGYDTAVNVPSGRVNIDDSEITIINAARGINGGEDLNDFTIKESTVNCFVSGANAVAIANGQDIRIDNSAIVLTSASGNAIFAAGTIKIENGSKIDATGFYPALFGSAAVTIENSEVKAVSTDDFAIFSRGTISLAGGTIHAKGGPGLAAIAARAVRSADEAAASKITVSDLVDRNGAKAAFSDWFTHSSGQTRSWTTFIAEDASAVDVNASGGLVNAVNELWMGEPTQLTAPVITTQPAGQSVRAGENVTFSIAATGDPAPTYQWQVSANGSTWSNLADKTSVALILTRVALGDNGNKYRCIVTNPQGTAASNAAVLTVTDGGGGGNNDYTPPAQTTVYNNPSAPEATVWLSGNGLSQGDRLITQPVSRDGGYNAMIKLADKNDILHVYDISLQSGRSSIGNAMQLAFAIGSEYAGQTFTLVHQKADGSFEYFFATADAKGNVNFGPLYELSPFMLVKGIMPYTPLHEIVEVPKTGDSATFTGFAFLSLSIFLSALWLMRQSKSKRT